MLDIVMYHYVRPLKDSHYPKIKGLELKSFEKQLQYFLRERNIISTKNVIEATLGKKQLPEKAIWLTFDDGYKDHFTYVAPLLDYYGVDAAFFPVSNCYEENKILDVNKIHYILATAESDNLLIDTLRSEMRNEGFSRYDWETLWKETNKEHRYDNEKVSFFKKILQRELPLKIRDKIISNMFKNFVGRSEDEVSLELYMSKKELQTLHQRGFSLGSHTSSHMWLNKLSYAQQEKEIENSLVALKSLRGNLDEWIMAYPYGGYNKDTLKILKKLNCVLGLTTKVGSANLLRDNQLELKRLDTNDFPQ